MSTTKELKEYLINEGDGFLLNDDNNGKTIMLSGAWGAGKTHFWQNEISPRLKEKQTNIYVSLYGKESIDEIKFDILKEAYNSQVKENFISKSAALLSTIAPSFGEKSLTDGFEKLNNEAKGEKATEILRSGSVICLDDFERKSKKVDLNDLFGFISQLAIDMHCKMVIILNSDVFEGEEANVFKNVKEKTISKYFHFDPTIKELLASVAEDEKYNQLNDYKEDILKVIEETEELNARIYIQVLDNCLEWIEKGYDSRVLRALILSTINFILNNTILDSPSEIKVPDGTMSGTDILHYESMYEYPHILLQAFGNDSDLRDEEFIYRMLHDMLDNEKIIGLREEEYRIWIKENTRKIKALWKYGYRLNYVEHVDKDLYKIICKLVKTGILPKKNKEVESSLPQEAISKIKA